MGVQGAATAGTSRNRIGTCTRGPVSWADLAVRVDRGRNLLIPPLVGVASRPAQLPAKFKAERQFRGRCIGT